MLVHFHSCVLLLYSAICLQTRPMNQVAQVNLYVGFSVTQRIYTSGALGNGHLCSKQLLSAHKCTRVLAE